MNKALKRLISLALVAVMVLGIVPANIGFDPFDFITVKSRSFSYSDGLKVYNPDNKTGEDIVNQAKKYLGCPYYGGTDINIRTGYGTTVKFDCSGFVYRVLKDVNLQSDKKGSGYGSSYNKISESRWYITAHTGHQREYGYIFDVDAIHKINSGDFSDLLPGDLLFFNYSYSYNPKADTISTTATNHVVIYEGNGRFINAQSGTTSKIAEASLNEKFAGKTACLHVFAATRLIDMIHCSNAITSCSATATAVCSAGYSTTSVRDIPYSDKAKDGTQSKEVFTLKNKDKVKVTGMITNDFGSKWYRIEYGGKTGWSHESHISNITYNGIDLSKIKYYYGYGTRDEKQIKLNDYNRCVDDKHGISTRGDIKFDNGKIVDIKLYVIGLDGTNKGKTVFEGKAESINATSFAIEKLDGDMKFKSLKTKGLYSMMLYYKIKPNSGIKIDETSKTVNLATFAVSDSSSKENAGVMKNESIFVSITNGISNVANNIVNQVGKLEKVYAPETQTVKEDVKPKETPKETPKESAKETEKVEIKPTKKDTQTVISVETKTGTYKVGIYKTSTSDNTNIRTGAGTSYAKAGNAIPKGTEITVTEVSSNGWGKTSYGGAAGWVALNTCKYLREIPKINKPGKVTVTYNSAKDIPTGKNVEVKWNAIGDTDSYTVYLKNSSGKVIATQEKITGTKTSFNIANAGTYYFTVRAVNSKYTGDESAASASFTAHAPCKVTFKYWNNKTEVRTVTYGEDAVAPVDPTRAGYKFIGWDNSYTKVTSDITVNAKYEKKMYTVVFTTDDGRIIGKSQSVLYQDSAVEPGDDEKQAHAEPGYVFVGWSNDNWKCVTGNATVKAVYSWGNADLPVVITNPVADQKTTDAGEIYGYNVTFNLSCPKGSMENGRAIVSLKTSDNKQIVTTESAAFSLNNDTNGKLIEVFVPSVDYAWKCEIYIVDSFGNPLPLSNMAECPITRIKNEIETTWSGWTPDVKTGYAAREQRTTYSYRTKSTTTETTKTLSGWTYEKTTSELGAKVSGLTTKPAAVNTDAQVRSISSTTTDVYSTWYRYVHYTNGGYNTSTKKSTTWACAPTKGNTSDGYGPTSIGPHYYESSKKLTPEKSTTFNVNKYKATCSASVSTPATNCTCKNTWFYNETPFQKKTGTKTTYSYQDTFYTYHFYKWSAWSSYSTTAQTASSTKEVRTRTEYRYRYDVTKTVSEDVSQNNQDDSGVARLATTKHAGLLKTDIPLPNLKAQAGKTLIMYICKHNEASDWTGEFIGQTKIDSNGDYQFKFTLREEPTAETGDFIVTIGVEGCKDIIIVGSITAPEPEYKVVFKAKDPSKNDSEYTVVSEKTVIEGQPVAAPQNPEYPGYRFLGWNTDLSYVTESNMFVEYGKSKEEKTITFTAKYDPIEYDVLFIDWDSDRFEHQVYHYGDTIIPPVLVAEDGHEAVWDGLTEGQTVTGDMVITAKRDKKNYDVVFYDFDGNVIDTQTVPYQDEAEEVEIEENENMIFLGWEYTEEYPEETVNGETVVGEDPVVKFYPVYVFAEDTASPAASVVTGTYDDVQTVELTCETEGAVIYYTLDGSDPRTNGEDGELEKSVYEYSEPIVLNRSTVLTFYAEAFEHNASEPVVEYYAINAGVEESDWMTYDELPDYVTENPSEYNIQSTAGYRFKDVITTSNLSTIQSCENNGWTLDSKVTDTEGSDWVMSEPVLDDTDFELEIGEPEEEEESRYQYSRYKYVDSATGVTLYSYFAPEGIESELETVQPEGKLSLAGYVSGTTVKYYNYNSETWYNQEIVTVMVKPDYKMYRYFLNTSTYSRWTPWTMDAPSADESRETQTETLWKYSIPETHLVNIDYNGAEFGVSTETFIVEKNDLVPFNAEDYTHEGYDFIGFFTDEEYTHFFDITDTPVTADMTLYPKYSAHTFDVIFIDHDGTVLSEETVDYGDWAMEPEVNGKDGYVFIGWDSEDYTFVSKDLIIEAQYVPENEYCTVKLDRNKYNMMAGNSFRLNAAITPEDTENPNVIWYSTDEEVAVVDDEGNVTALTEGFAEIVVEAESTGEIDVCALTVSANPSDEICLSYTSSLSLDKDFDLLRGVKNNTWTASSIKDEFINDAEDLVITDINGVELAEDAIVGTGAVIKFMNGGTVKDEITVVVTGDMNGDGKVNNRDAAMITRYLVDKETASFAQMCAIDVNGDGNINVRDASMVSRYLVGKEEI